MDRNMQRPAFNLGNDPPKIPQKKQVPNLPDRFFNKDGELDMREVTGADALRYVRALGWAV